MRIEDGVKYYEDGEWILPGTEWNYGFDHPGAAIAYHVTDDLVCIRAEVITQEDVEKIWKLLPEYSDKKYVILRRTNIGKSLLL